MVFMKQVTLLSDQLVLLGLPSKFIKIYAEHTFMHTDARNDAQALLTYTEF